MQNKASKRYKLFVHLIGGLGNQQFQYAVGKLLAEEYRRDLVLDTSYYLNRYQPVKAQGKYCPYVLDNFLSSPPKYVVGIKKELLGLINSKNIFQKGYRKLKAEKLGKVLPKLVFQDDKSFDKSLKMSQDVVLNGYFQNHILFHQKNNGLKDLFSPQFSVSECNQKFLEPACQIGSVSVHVRRGDYLVSSQHVNLALEYYHKALAEVEKKAGVSKVLVFSDDIPWAKEHLKFSYPTVYVDTPGPDYEHQYLMSVCAHNIIANSTFSWWAAMMNRNPEKIVCSPQNWFTYFSTSDLVFLPKSWVLIEEN